MQLKLISGTANLPLAEEIAMHSGIPLTNRIIKRFKDGECYIQISENVRGDDVFLIQSTCTPVNESLMELLILIDAAKRASAGRITVVMPYFGYARQDRKAEAREPITSKLVADLLTKAGANRILAVDLHVAQIQGFFDIPVDEVSIVPLFSKYFAEKNLSDIIIVAPDVGAVKKVRIMAKRLNTPIAIIDKRRTVHNDTEIINIVGDIAGKTVILLDDIIDTGNTIAKSADLLAKTAKEVYICATHAVFSNGCDQRLIDCAAKEIIVSNTIPVHCTHPKIKMLSIGTFLSDVIRNIHENKSVSALFIN
ncbi:MAG: ribose-phosphate pyrophosphokinase [Candidatus Woesearchaeota archaeon]